MLKTLLTILVPLLLKCSFVLPKGSPSRAPNAVLDIADSTTVDIPSTGGTVQLDELTVKVDAGTVNTDFKIKISRTD
jgi:hypothetical protein